MTTETQALVARAIDKCDRRSAYQLAQVLDVSYQAVQQWQNGKTRPGITACYRLADHLGVSREDVLSVVMAEKHKGHPQGDFWERMAPRVLPAALVGAL